MVSSPRKIYHYLHHNFPLGVTNEEVLSTPIKRISGAVTGDSKLQDRGVAHYLLPLLFILIILPFSFYLCLCVLYPKYQKNCLPCSCFSLLLWVPLKTLSFVTLQVTTIMTLFALYCSSHHFGAFL